LRRSTGSPGVETMAMDFLNDVHLGEIHGYASTGVSLLVIALITLIASRVAVARIPRMFPSASLIATVLQVTIVSVGILVALGSLGISIAPVLTALGVGGLAVALALRDTLANLFAGIQILASGQVLPGDFVRFEGGEGYVADITWRNTSITDNAGARVIVPNEKLAGSIVSNATRPDGLRIVYTFGLAPSLDIAGMLAAAREKLAALDVSELRVIAQSEAAVTCAALATTEAKTDAFARRAAIAEVIAQLPRLERVSS
jgi:small-conductance mechanosensitive channel